MRSRIMNTDKPRYWLSSVVHSVNRMHNMLRVWCCELNKPSHFQDAILFNVNWQQLRLIKKMKSVNGETFLNLTYTPLTVKSRACCRDRTNEDIATRWLYEFLWSCKFDISTSFGDRVNGTKMFLLFNKWICKYAVMSCMSYSAFISLKYILDGCTFYLERTIKKHLKRAFQSLYYVEWLFSVLNFTFSYSLLR